MTIRTIVVEDLGFGSALVELGAGDEKETVLFIDALTDWEERIELMSDLIVGGMDSW